MFEVGTRGLLCIEVNLDFDLTLEVGAARKVVGIAVSCCSTMMLLPHVTISTELLDGLLGCSAKLESCW